MKKGLKIGLSLLVLFLIGFPIYSYFNSQSIQKYASADVNMVDLKGSKIVAFGDSITEGINTDEEKKWTTLLSNDLGATVINSGVAGDSTKEGLKRLQEDVIEKDADYVLINFGMNDHYFEKENKEMVSLEKFKKNLTKMIAETKKSGAFPIVVLPHAVIEGDKGDGNMGEGATYYYLRHPSDYYEAVGGANKQLELYNNASKEVADNYEVPIIDIYGESLNQDLFQILRNLNNSPDQDGVHLSEDGMNFYAEVISRDIKDIVTN